MQNGKRGNMKIFNDIYKGKKVLITGHTGFKGSWLTQWMLNIGANVIGVSMDIPTKPSLFETLELDKSILNFKVDIRNLDKLKKIFKETKPDFVFHLAAQPIVSLSYSDPINTISTNVIGTMNVLESVRDFEHNCSIVIITSDKCYDNVEWIWGYKETDALGGKDIYSGSKGAAELIFKSYFHSFLRKKSNLKIASARAGNVIGGGDWAKDRIVPDCIRAWSVNNIVEIRSPKATRPWQHVLEPLSGYLELGNQLYQSNKLNGESFNFGPSSESTHTVEDLINDLSKTWKFKNQNDAYKCYENIHFHEAGLLKLNCDKALFYLSWKPTLNYNELIEYTGNWYYKYYKSNKVIAEYTIDQINNYIEKAKEKHILWAQG